MSEDIDNKRRQFFFREREKKVFWGGFNKMAVYDLCLPQSVYRLLLEKCEEANVDRETLEWVFGKKTLAFLGPSQYASLRFGDISSVSLDEKDKTVTSPAHEFGSYIAGERARMNQRTRIVKALAKYRIKGLKSRILPVKEVGPWVDHLNRHYKFEESLATDESSARGGPRERWSVRLPYGRKVGFPQIGEFISLKRGEEIFECSVIDLGKARTATASITLEQ